MRHLYRPSSRVAPGARYRRVWPASFLMGDVNQEVEPVKIVMAADNGSDVMIEKHCQLLYGLAECIQ